MRRVVMLLGIALLLVGLVGGAWKDMQAMSLSQTAASVGTQTLTTSQARTLAEEAVAEIGALPEGVTEQAVERQVTTTWVQSQVLDAVSQQQGLTVTDQQVADLIAQAEKQNGGPEALAKALANQYGIAPSQIPDFARANLQYQGLATKLGNGNAQAGGQQVQSLIASTASATGVSVNPSIGAWSSQQFAIEAPSGTEESSPWGDWFARAWPWLALMLAGLLLLIVPAVARRLRRRATEREAEAEQALVEWHEAALAEASDPATPVEDLLDIAGAELLPGSTESHERQLEVLEAVAANPSLPATARDNVTERIARLRSDAGALRENAGLDRV